MAGAISLLVDSPLRDLALVMREVPTGVKRQISAQTKKAAKPIWLDEVRSRTSTRIQTRVILETSDVSVTARNVTLKVTGRGVLAKTGTPRVKLLTAAEHGINPTARIRTKSRKGTKYKRAAGATFGANNRAGYVAGPSASNSIPRLASLWVQTAVREIHEAIEKVK